MERYLVLLWFKRFDTVNKGLMRLFSVGLILISLYLTAYITDEVYYAHTLMPILFCLFVVYILIILSFRILIWIYDGIVGNE
jgi:hypothetical protein